MQIGICQIAQSFGYDAITDAQVYEEEIKSGVLADELGYDLVSMVEHHFEDYALCPDNFVYLAHLAAKTRRIKLMTGAVIVPWNTQPLRVAEKAALLDMLRVVACCSGSDGVFHGGSMHRQGSRWMNPDHASMKPCP